MSVHRLGEGPVELTEADALDGGNVLPGLSIPVANIVW